MLNLGSGKTGLTTRKKRARHLGRSWTDGKRGSAMRNTLLEGLLIGWLSSVVLRDVFSGVRMKEEVRDWVSLGSFVLPVVLYMVIRHRIGKRS